MKRLLLCLCLLACETEHATSAVVDNQASSPVYRAWWVTTYFDTPVAPGASSPELRSVPATDLAYVLLAPGWDPAGSAPPASFVAMKSKQPLSVARGDALHIAVSDVTFFGDCAASQPLSLDDATFIADRIFPGELAGMIYDPKTCTYSAPGAADAGTDARP